MIPATSRRVIDSTDDEINEQIRLATEARIAACAAQGPEAINARLRELDREWDIERCVETVAPSLSLVGLCLGLTRHRAWLLVPFVVQGFFLQHALQGWCPPVPLLRRMGVRTAEEIHEERYALKALRGDFQYVEIATPRASSNSVMEAVRR